MFSGRHRPLVIKVFRLPLSNTVSLICHRAARQPAQRAPQPAPRPPHQTLRTARSDDHPPARWRRLQPGFSVAQGGEISVTIGAVSCTAARSSQTATAAPGPLADPSLSETRPLASAPAQPQAPTQPPLLSTQADSLPDWLQAQLSAHGIDLSEISSSLRDTDDRWLILETTQALQTCDRNAASDLYRLDLLSDRLQLISATEQGQAGNGPSRYPSADASGELIVFHSEANDLVAGDHNQVSDLYLRDIALEHTSRLTQAEQASAHPALDAIGEYLLFDQITPSGQRQVLGQALLDPTRPAQTLSRTGAGEGATADHHHPAISADGRYIGYLEQQGTEAEAETETETEQNCQVHLIDRDTQVYHLQACPEVLAKAAEHARPAFSAQADQLHWYLPGRAEPITLSNPLAEPGSESGEQRLQ